MLAGLSYYFWNAALQWDTRSVCVPLDSFECGFLIYLNRLLSTCYTFYYRLHLHAPKPPHPTYLPLCSSNHTDSDSLSSPTRLSLSLSDGSEDQLDRLQQVELARTTPMSQWRAGTVQAWLEVVMAMPMYIRTCSENVKSGKVTMLILMIVCVCVCSAS